MNWERRRVLGNKMLGTSITDGLNNYVVWSPTLLIDSFPPYAQDRKGRYGLEVNCRVAGHT